MMHTAWGIATYNAIPVYTTILTFIVLVHRAKRDGIRCKQQYGEAWTQYCQKVPYNLIPGIF